MKKVLLLTVILGIIATAGIGCLMIFGMLSFAEGMEFILKAWAGILLLGAASAVITLIVGRQSRPEQADAELPHDSPKSTPRPDELPRDPVDDR